MFVPVVGAVLLPLRYLNTHLHELGHALMALGTGGQVERIVVYGDGSGVTPVAGGILPLVASAGYLGAAAAGAALVWSMRTERGARAALGVLGIALLLSQLLFVRGDLVGVVSGFAWSFALIAGWRLLRGRALQFTVAFLGLQQGLNALRSLLELLQITAASETHSDALLMQRETLIPAVVWAFLWGVAGLAVVLLTVRRTWAPPRAPSARDGRPAADR